MYLKHSIDMLRVGHSVLSYPTIAEAEEASARLGNRCLVIISLAVHKFYALVRDAASVPKLSSRLCASEVVLNNTARPLIDFDCDMGDKIDEVEKVLLQYYLDRHGLHVTLSWRYSDAPDRRWHCVVSGVYYRQCWTEGCIAMATHLSGAIPSLSIDTGVYRYRSSLRMLGQFKYDKGLYHRRLVPLVPCDPCSAVVTPLKYDIPMSEEHLPMRVVLPRPSVSIEGLSQIPDGLVLGKLMHRSDQTQVYRLDRVKPSYCPLCCRTHDRENSMLVVTGDSTSLRCFRQLP